MNKEKNFVSAVIYVYNAETAIEKFLNSIVEVFENNFEHSEVICVNDASTDKSAEIIKKMSNDITGTTVTLINMSYYHGLENAMNAGVDLSIGDFVYEFDNTNLDYNLDEIMNIYRTSLKGFDIVSASANVKPKLSSSLFYSIFNKLSGENVQITTESFRILSRRAINRIDSLNKTIPYRKAVYVNCGLKSTNLKYATIHNQQNKTDKKEKSYRFDLAVDSFILFTNIGYRISLFLTLAMMVLAMAMAVFCLVVYVGSNPIEGWTTTVLFLSGAFFGLFAILTIVIKYLQVLVDLVFKRKQYNFESVEKLTK